MTLPVSLSSGAMSKLEKAAAAAGKEQSAYASELLEGLLGESQYESDANDVEQSAAIISRRIKDDSKNDVPADQVLKNIREVLNLRETA